VVEPVCPNPPAVELITHLLQQSDISELLSRSTPYRKAQCTGDDKGEACSAEEHD
jgi:hypothetical protein